MKVLHVIPSVAPSYGGPARAIIEMERALSDLGVEVTTVTTADGESNSRNPGPIGIPTASKYATRICFSTQSKFYRVSVGMAAWLEKNLPQYDILHAHALFCFPPVVAGYLAKLKRVPYILRPLGVLNKYGMTQRRAALKKLSVSVIERRLIRSAAAIHFTSIAEQTEAEQLGLSGRGVVIPLGISEISGVKEHTREFLSSSHTKLLFLSRLDPKKNVEALLEAFALICVERSDFKLVIAGDGNPQYVDGLKKYAKNLRISGSVTWLGHVDGKLKAREFSDAAVFVLPSFSENFGIAVVEALANGLPCVVSTDVAIASAIEKAGAGVVTGTDAPSIAAGIIRVLHDASIYKAMCKAATELVVREFSSATMGARLLELYKCILDHGAYSEKGKNRQESYSRGCAPHASPP